MLAATKAPIGASEVPVIFNPLVFLLVYLPMQALGGLDYSTPPPADWPTLAVSRHYGKVSEHCAQLGIGTLACAVVDFDNNTCDIYWPSSPPEWMIRHEEAHCKGYDHYGDSIMRDAWAQHRQKLLDLKPETK